MLFVGGVCCDLWGSVCRCRAVCGVCRICCESVMFVVLGLAEVVGDLSDEV